MTFPRWFSAEMRDVLIEHVHGPVPVDNTRSADPHRRRTIVALVRRSLLGYEHRERKTPRRVRWRLGFAYEPRRRRKLRPTVSVLTDGGRALLCAVLADYADALARAGVVAEMLHVRDPIEEVAKQFDNFHDVRLRPPGTNVPHDQGAENDEAREGTGAGAG